MKTYLDFCLYVKKVDYKQKGIIVIAKMVKLSSVIVYYNSSACYASPNSFRRVILKVLEKERMKSYFFVSQI